MGDELLDLTDAATEAPANPNSRRHRRSFHANIHPTILKGEILDTVGGNLPDYRRRQVKYNSDIGLFQ